MQVVSRRHLLRRLGLGALAVGLTGFASTLVRFLLPNVEQTEPSRVEAGLPSDLPTGQAFFVRGNRTWLLHDTGGFYALSAICRHLGCTVRWENGRFACPCHGSEFDASGTPRRGPANQPLAPVWVGSDTQGRLVVDRGRVVPLTFRWKG